MTGTDASLWHGTTILSVRKAGRVVIAGDGQVTLGATWPGDGRTVAGRPSF